MTTEKTNLDIPLVFQGTLIEELRTPQGTKMVFVESYPGERYSLKMETPWLMSLDPGMEYQIELKIVQK
jgi:hypothetical protein